MLRRIIAVLFGLGMTAASIALVTAVNAPPPHPAPQLEAHPPPITVAPTVRPEARSDPAPSTSLSLPAPIPSAPAPLAEAARLPTFVDAHPALDLGAALVGLSNVGALPEVATPEPDQPARALRRPPANYPDSARRRGIEGEVVLRLRIDERGRVQDVFVVSAEPKGVFEASAVAAARRYVYEPASSRGASIATTLEQRVVFRLQ